MKGHQFIFPTLEDESFLSFSCQSSLLVSHASTFFLPRYIPCQNFLTSTRTSLDQATIMILPRIHLRSMLHTDLFKTWIRSNHSLCQLKPITIHLKSKCLAMVYNALHEWSDTGFHHRPQLFSLLMALFFSHNDLQIFRENFSALKCYFP